MTVPHQIRKVFEGRVFSVVVESITTRKGGKMDVEIVRHPGSVVLIPMTERGEIVLASSVTGRQADRVQHPAQGVPRHRRGQ